ncbi:MAG TPA: DUF3562 domain-containing protein [Nitrospirota bacterium]|jgi:hypothetical protein|nr:DUF3562 domain-containing protein [Nitrospirota bacterium]
MKENALYENVAEQRRHQAAIENVAQDLRRSIESVNTVYEIVLARYKKKARIKDFLSPLVTKRVKELLRDNTLPSDIEGRRSRFQDL